MPVQTIHLHARAPAKPAEGQPCNGCGVCCILETCPVARVRFLRKNGPCPALVWADNRYQCGLLVNPALYLPFLPARLLRVFSRLMFRWIAAGQGCDCDAEVTT